MSITQTPPHHSQSSPSPQYSPIVSLDRWHSSPIPLIDLRSPQDYQTKRIFFYTQNTIPIINLPLESLLNGKRSCELPPRSISFAILVPSPNDINRVLNFFFATKSRVTNQSRKPWNVKMILSNDEMLWNDADRFKLLLQGRQENNNNNNNNNNSEIETVTFPLPRLWQPDPLIRTEVLPYLIQFLLCKETDYCSSSATNEIWDLGSGAGRDLCFLAEEIKAHRDHRQKRSSTPPLRFVGLDHHKKSQEVSSLLFQNRDVDDIARAQFMNLNKIELFHEHLQCNHVLCCYAIRYLNRKLLKYLVSETCALKCGVIFAMSHFCKEKEGAIWKFDHPKVKNVLERHELKDLFEESQSWEVLKNDICLDGDHGRTLIQFVAKKL